MTVTAAAAPPSAAHAPAPGIRGVGVITGWGEGVGVLPAEAPAGAAGVVPVPTPALGGDRFRRATRECVLAVAAAKAAVADAGLSEAEISGPGTGILYVSATGYAAANRAFLEDETSTTLHFPYTSPSAVPGEVTIELGVRGPYVNLMGGGPSTLHALGWAASWLAEGRADRLLVLAVEAFHDVRDLFGRARRLYAGPLVEGAACLVLAPGSGAPGAVRWASALAGPSGGGRTVSTVL
ncbi:MAG: beta-ketoacyl synthase N-terminal-like domain-containing protein, partial [Candidatus Rokuibacteriota bacterium]